MNELMYDPTSSWGYRADEMSNTSNIVVNASGLRFSVKFMGFVPLKNSLHGRSKEEKDEIVRICINTVVSSDFSDHFKTLLKSGDVGPFVSLNGLDVFLQISNFTIAFFHYKENNTSLLLGRYKNDTLSHYKAREIDGIYYMGMVMVNRQSGKRECNVIKLGSKIAVDEFVRKLQSVDSIEPVIGTLESRLRSTRDYAYKIPMLSFYHGKISYQDACKKLVANGDFLCRARETSATEYAVVWKNEEGYGTYSPKTDDIEFFYLFQTRESWLKRPIVYLRY